MVWEGIWCYLTMQWWPTIPSWNSKSSYSAESKWLQLDSLIRSLRSNPGSWGQLPLLPFCAGRFLCGWRGQDLRGLFGADSRDIWEASISQLSHYSLVTTDLYWLFYILDICIYVAFIVWCLNGQAEVIWCHMKCIQNIPKHIICSLGAETVEWFRGEGGIWGLFNVLFLSPLFRWAERIGPDSCSKVPDGR